MILPNNVMPKDLGFDENKFPHWRKGQTRAVETASSALYERERSTFMLDSPTGSGKSLLGQTLSRVTCNNVTYLVSTKQLQDQIANDFVHTRILKGRANYPCYQHEVLAPNSKLDITAADCTHTKEDPCKFKGVGGNTVDCPYEIAKLDALGASACCLNVAMFLTEANYVGRFSDRSLVVIDEADMLEDHLMSFAQLLITQRQIDRLSLGAPRFKTKFEAWQEWANDVIPTIKDRIATLSASMWASSASEYSTINPNTIREKRMLVNMLTKLSFFASNVDTSWVWRETPTSWEFKPTWVDAYADGLIWSHGEKFLLMSATILDPRQMASDVGIEDGKWEYMRMSSLFPLENRPVYYTPVVNLTSKTMKDELPKLVNAIKGISLKHNGEKGLVHCVSYRVRDYLLENLGLPNLITHGSNNRAQQLTRFKRSKEPLIMLSPSFDRGIDLVGDECRFLVVAKCPFLDLGDKQVAKRVYTKRGHDGNDGQRWYRTKALRSMVQMTGRGVRSAEDYCSSYLLDAQCGRLIDQGRTVLPDWWLDAVVES